jgi:hypothetical protein
LFASFTPEILGVNMPIWSRVKSFFSIDATDIHAILTFSTTQPTIPQLVAAAKAGMSAAGIDYVQVTAWYGTVADDDGKAGWRISTVFPSPGPTLNEQEKALMDGISAAGLGKGQTFTISVYHHPLPSA